MRDARYLRDQATLCLEIARQMSDPKTADNLKAEAARYQAQATALEAGEPPALQAAEEQPALQAAEEQPALQEAGEQPPLQEAEEQPVLQALPEQHDR